MRNLFIQHKEALKDLLRYAVLKVDTLENHALYNGKLGMAILFYEYSRYSRDELYEQFADDILDSILELPDTLSFRLSDGLSGIGWGITYLLTESFIIGDIEDILFEVDMKIKEINILDKDEMDDYQTYLKFRENYMNTKKKRQVSDISYKEDYILNQIWKSCFSITN